ncbi:MAG: FadR family transcriptional regulator [Myxococcales bacterium]|nr:FadR family transcriptional regulator [Myxococcales bacterium]
MGLRRIAKKTLSDEVYEQLSGEIVEGRFGPGISLPAERQLCDMLGVNRGAIREALKRLEQAGLVSISQGGGTKVLDFRRNAGLDLLMRLLFRRDGTVNLDVARSVMEMRAVLAPDIARLCARRADAAQVAVLRRIITEMEAAAATDELPELQVLSLHFWDAMVRGSGNIAYELAFNTLRETYDRLREVLVHVMADEIRDVRSHRTIAEAVARGDELSAKHVAGALMEQGTRRVLELVAALRDATRHGEDQGSPDPDDAG